ncbi:MAG: hypothetical protein A4E57_04835 [Syntrophorhabdaceae bacterium PtaU1.Bin034]|nr:MAG: hypothetical protein A4E57_04835 [Syntrophorhabdaceae bacterium PtaU1.Bin034]
MKAGPECRECLYKWVYERTAPYLEEAERFSLPVRLDDAIDSGIKEYGNLGLLCNTAVYAAGGPGSCAASFYEEFKQKANREARRLLPVARKYMERGRSPQERFERACILAAAGNVSPLGAPSAPFTFPDLVGVTEGRVHGAVMGDAYDIILHARHILYITDNAGEIGFDSLVLEAVKEKGAAVSLVVKEDPFFEDARMGDVLHFHLEAVADEVVTSKGFLTPSGDDGPAGEALAKCDVIIAKGTGSFESFWDSGVGKETIFLLKVKCKPIARDLGVDEGTIVVKASKSGS